MRSVAVVIAVVCISVAFAAPVKVWQQYPLDIVTVAAPNETGGTTTTQVVHVLTAAGPVNINRFMQVTVPASLQATNALPAPSGANTDMLDVALPAVKGFVEEPLHPVWLKVVATRDNGISVTEGMGEKFMGKVCEPGCWSVCSYFITRYCAWARVDKIQETTVIPEPIDIANTYNWVDP